MNNKKNEIQNQKHFVDAWLSDPLFEKWLSKEKCDTQARCTICHKTIVLSSAGRSALTDHAKGKKHNEALNKRNNFFKSPSSKNQKVSNEQSKCSEAVEKQPTLESFITNSDTLKAEIIWSLKSIINGFSVRSNDELSDTLVAMFPDSKIAKSFNMARTKSMYIINHGLYPYFKSMLLSTVQKSDICVYSFDESLNDVTQTCEMDLYVRFWDTIENEVKVRYWNSTFFGHGRHQDLLQHFSEVTKELNPGHLYQISMDGPNVNLKFFKEFAKARKDDMLHTLIDIGSCSLHIVHGSFKTGAKKSNWNIKETLRGVFQILHNTPARREDYESVTGCFIYPLFFCDTR